MSPSDCPWCHGAPWWGEHVRIIPLRETGTVKRIRPEDSTELPETVDNLIFDVVRDSDGETHLCRARELGAIDG